MTKTIQFGSIVVRISDQGLGKPTWGDSASHTEYDVSVSEPPGAFAYKTKAWGSKSDFEAGKLDHESIAAMVVGELYSAVVDPDEFLELVMGDASGREALKRGRVAEAVIESAKKFDEESLRKAVDIIRERGLD